jgi:Cft2 family RNA processing exonuclease
VVQGWRLGKSQEVLHYLLAEGFDVLVDERIYQVAEAYQQAGVTFPGDPHLFKGHWPDGYVLLCPPGRRSAVPIKGYRGLRYMELTGWAVDSENRWGRRGDANLPLSDHPDFNELLEYVRLAQPKQVYTVNGFPELAAHLRGLDIPAVHLSARGQPQDTGFQMRLV